MYFSSFHVLGAVVDDKPLCHRTGSLYLHRRDFHCRDKRDGVRLQRIEEKEDAHSSRQRSSSKTETIQIKLQLCNALSKARLSSTSAA